MKEQPTQKPRRTRARIFNDSERAEHLKHWKQSGLSAQAYGRKHAISDKSLYAWRSRSRRAEESSHAPDAPAFVPVRVSALPSSASQGSLKVILRTGDLECVVSGAGSTDVLVSLVKSLKQEVFDV